MPNDKKQQHCSLEFPPHVTQRQEHPYKLSDRGLRVEFWVTNCRACSVRRRWFSVLPHATISHLTSNFFGDLLPRREVEARGWFSSGSVSRMIEGGENSTDESPIRLLLGVSGMRVSGSAQKPGTWISPGVDQEYGRAFLAFLLGEFSLPLGGGALRLTVPYPLSLITD